ncbi:hypothetical protein HMN09_00845500 [Mycena chlorophos]|uniref:Uncharacterized protein n=1 Tax=Mycena chlorophos TaxID=658473 RepID=A0A8H6SSI1_MYCCL|nr:hypothetical protein HMN09_00845500 [Mycena chlorophos]
MPKRIPTPEPGDDEPKYFTVVQPYPLNANWELPHDYITCGRWVASCLGSDAPFFALFYKPSARGQVLLEINRDYAYPEKLLGEHRWSEFLRKPSEEEKGRVTQIFYSTYSNGRAAQKDGWKRINVADSWFKNWSPKNAVISNPYPVTRWCPLPPEDKTNKPMCRPLPVALKPPPPTAAPPPPVVPGSSAWHDKKTAPPSDAPTILKGAWATKQASIQAKTAKNIPATSTAPWHNPTAPKSNNVAISSAPAFEDLPTLSRTSTGTASSGASSNPSSDVDPIAEQLAGVSVSISPSQEARLYGDAADAHGAGMLSPDPNAYVAEWEKTAFTTTWTSVAAPPGALLAEEESENLWGEEDDIESKKQKATEILCPVHGIICKKGICREYSKLLKERERGGHAKGNGNKNGGGGWKKHTWDDDSGSATGSEGRGGYNKSATTTKARGNAWSSARRGR